MIEGQRRMKQISTGQEEGRGTKRPIQGDVMTNVCKFILIAVLVLNAAAAAAESFDERRLLALSARKEFQAYHTSVMSKIARTYVHMLSCYSGNYYWENTTNRFVFDISPEGTASNLQAQLATPEAECVGKIVLEHTFPPPPAYPGDKGFPFLLEYSVTPGHSVADTLPPAEDKGENDAAKGYFGGCRFSKEEWNELVLTGAGITWHYCVNQPYKILEQRRDLLVLQIDKAGSCMADLEIGIVKVQFERENQFDVSFYGSETKYLFGEPSLQESCSRFSIAVHVQRASRTKEGQAEIPAPLEAAGQAFDRGDYEQAFSLLVPLAEHGDARAQATLGAMYLSGLGVTKDDSKAVYWTRKAADAGNPKAQTNLGLIYFYGRGVPQDDTQAAEWLKKAAIRGNASARSTLGILFLEGRGVEKNYIGAKALFSSAIRDGEVGAANNLAKIIEQGLGQAPDVKGALKLYEIAAKFGDPAAQNRIGLACMNGEFRDRNIGAAKDWFMKSASQGEKYGQYHLGMLLLDEKPADTLPALKWISLSARQEYEPAQLELNTRSKALDDSEKAALRKLVDSWRPVGRGAFDAGVK